MPIRRLISRFRPSPNESVLESRVPTQSFFLSFAPTLSTAFLSPPLECGFGSMCQGWLEPSGVSFSAARREDERDLRRANGRSLLFAVWVVVYLRDEGGVEVELV